MNFNEVFDAKKKSVEEIVYSFLPTEKSYQETIVSAMEYSVKAGGKRLRPLMMQEMYLLFGGRDEIIKPFMAAIEMIHTYSLVHDDLPAMDNDMYRRGRLTTHAVYGEGMGILAGDALLNYAFETALTGIAKSEGKKEDAVRALSYLAQKAGIYGMIGGQTADVEAEGKKDVDIDLLLYIHDNKTAALIEAAMCCGAILAGASDEDIAKVEKIARNTGVAFQIRDDILDVEGDFEKLGKPIGSDAENEKVTYVTLKGLDAAKEDVKSLTDEAISLLASLPGDTGFLKELLLSLVGREN